MSDNVIDHIPALRIFSRVLCRGHDEAEALVQETLLRAIEYSTTYEGNMKMRSWLCTIMRNCFYTNLKRRRREGADAEVSVSSAASKPGTQERHEQGCQLTLALHGLPLSYREAMVVVLVIGESYANAAQILDCDIGTIKSRVNRGRNMLKVRLGEVPVTSPTTRLQHSPLSLCPDFSTGSLAP